MGTLTTNLDQPIVDINIELGLNQHHSFQISFVSSSASYNLKTSVIIYRDGMPVLNGIVTNYSYDAAGKIMTISGQDANSFYYQHDQSDNPRTCSNDTLTTVAAALNSLDTRGNNDVAASCPVVSCFGYGSYNGATHDMVDRVCNSFGLNYYSNPTGSGYSLSSGGLREPSNYTAAAGYNYTQNSDLDSIISKIYIQKAVTASQRRRVDIKNGSTSSSQTVRLTNPNHVLAAEGSSQFPIDYFIDPWTKSFVTIDVPVNSNMYNVAVNVGETRQITYVNCNDSLADPAWKLEIWDNNPGEANQTATRLGYLSKGQVWVAQDDETAGCVRVARDETVNGITATVFPTYDGVVITAYVWEQPAGSDVEAWSQSYSSGDTDGRPDYNIISDDMYPNKAVFDAQHLGQQIAKRDSLTMQRKFSLPGIKAVSVLDNIALSNDGESYAMPVTSISYQVSPGQESTELRGEW